VIAVRAMQGGLLRSAGAGCFKTHEFPSLVRPDSTSSAGDCDVAALDVYMRLAEHRLGHWFSTETAWSMCRQSPGCRSCLARSVF
jgi:hypothetical protein